MAYGQMMSVRYPVAPRITWSAITASRSAGSMAPSVTATVNTTVTRIASRYSGLVRTWA